MNNGGALDGVFEEILEPLIEGSISSFELSGIIIFKLLFFIWGIWECSKLSSIVSSLISLIASTFGFKCFGWSFWYCFIEFLASSSGEGKEKKSFGKILLLFVFIVAMLYYIKMIWLRKIIYQNCLKKLGWVLVIIFWRLFPSSLFSIYLIFNK